MTAYRLGDSNSFSDISSADYQIDGEIQTFSGFFVGPSTPDDSFAFSTAGLVLEDHILHIYLRGFSGDLDLRLYEDKTPGDFGPNFEFDSGTDPSLDSSTSVSNNFEIIEFNLSQENRFIFDSLVRVNQYSGTFDSEYDLDIVAVRASNTNGDPYSLSLNSSVSITGESLASSNNNSSNSRQGDSADTYVFDVLQPGLVTASITNRSNAASILRAYDDSNDNGIFDSDDLLLAESSLSTNPVLTFQSEGGLGFGQVVLPSSQPSLTYDLQVNLSLNNNNSNSGDLNSDGKTDLLFYNPQFQWSGIAYMDGGNQISAAPLWNGWKPVGSSDFNNDGNTDIVVQNLDNDWYGILYMNGAGSIQAHQSIVGWQGWDIIGTGNFNNDGTEDILIRHQTENWYGVWYMGGVNGSQIVGSQGVTIWADWEIKATGDFNQDGRSDLVIQHQTQDWSGILYLDGDQQIVSSQSLAGWADWNIVGTTDLNNDGNTDLLIGHQSQPWDGVWYMNGNQIVSSSGLSTWAGWQITA